MIRICICDDQDIVREGLQTILDTARNIEVAFTASDGQDLIDRLEASTGSLPELILMDLKMPMKNGIQATKEVLHTWPEIKVLILTTYADDEWVIDSIKAGASGYLLKDTPKAKLIDAISGTVAGNTYVDPSIAGKLLPLIQHQPVSMKVPSHDLTDRERKILLYIAKGLSNTEIGERLFLSAGTVRNYVSAIFTKLEVSDRTEAAIAGLRESIFTLDEI